jgi:hypothetical protein
MLPVVDTAFGRGFVERIVAALDRVGVELSPRETAGGALIRVEFPSSTTMK